MLLYFNCDSEILAVDTGYTSPLIIVLEYYNKEEIGLIRKKAKYKWKYNNAL